MVRTEGSPSSSNAAPVSPRLGENGNLISESTLRVTICIAQSRNWKLELRPAPTGCHKQEFTFTHHSGFVLLCVSMSRRPILLVAERVDVRPNQQLNRDSGVSDDRMYGPASESAVGRKCTTDSYCLRCVRVPYYLCQIAVCKGKSAMPGGIRHFVARGRRMYGTDKPLFENAISDSGGIYGFAGARHPGRIRESAKSIAVIPSIPIESRDILGPQ